MIYHTDFDKAHRCPRRPDWCDGYVSCEETGWRWKRWHVYTCNACGLRVAKGLLIPHHPQSGDTWTGRAYWFWWHGPRLRWSNWFWPHCIRKIPRWPGR